VFRLEKAGDGSRINITIDGRLSMESIELVESCCDEAIAERKRIDLVLRDVSVVDEAGRALLRRLAVKGVHLFGHGLYTSYLVDSVKQPASR
jgi:hypothetical protein